MLASLAGLIIVVLALLAVRATRTPRPNIVLITLDTTRADHLGAYGYKPAHTPRLDRLAQEGVLFERAIAVAPITLPAHVSLLTGMYPFAHGVRNNGNFSLSDRIPTLATALHDRGYRTAAFVSAFVLDRRYGLARGFDIYDDRMQLERQGDRTASAAIEWLRGDAGGTKSSDQRPADSRSAPPSPRSGFGEPRRSSPESPASGGGKASAERPFFLWLHLYDPHDPYTPPARFRDAFADRLYDGEIAFDDEVVASVLSEAARVAPESSTIVAVAGDHGESLGEHGEATHAVFVYESTLRVPMILSWPGHLPAGRRVAAPVRGIDLAPTLLDLAGAPPLGGAQGTSLVPLAHGQAAKTRSFLYAESYFPLLYMNWAPLRSIQDEQWKFIDAPAPELYDLAADAAERTNLIERMPGRAAELRRALDELTGGAPGAMAERKLDREAAAKLAALGYVSASASVVTPQAGGDKPDPKQMIGVFNAIREANAALQQGRLDQAADLARDALARDPKNAFAVLVLANANRERGRYREAVAGYRAYVDLVPASADAHHRMAICYARLGEADRALAEAEAALAIDPRFGDAHDLRGGLLAERGRVDDAIRALRTAVAIDPDNAPYRVGLARVLVAARKLDEADEELRRALQLQPENADVHAGLAGLLVARGLGDAAVGEFQQSLKLRPEADDVRLDLARTLERLGRAADARRQYEQLASAPQTPADIRKAARARLR